MGRDTLKTVVGLVIIGLIVVATFLYGNAQRQAQVRHDQEVKQQQQEAKTAKATPSNSTAPNSAPTQPTKSPVAGAGQNAGGHGGQVAGAGSSIPTTGPSGSLPEAGAPVSGLVGILAIVAMILWVRRTNRLVLAAARTRR